MESKILIKNKTEMANFARKIARNCPKNQIIALNGTLGSGKTFFAQNFILELMAEKEEVTSPTFSIYHHYISKDKINIYHFDLYRIKNESELDNIGFYDLLKDGICLIEWPEIAKRYLKKNITNISIKILDGKKREIKAEDLPS